MGWIVDNCNEKSRKSRINLVIQYSASNIEGSKAVSSFIEYIRERNPFIHIMANPVENKNDLITISYYSRYDHEIIYSGNNFNQSLFDSLYEKLR